MTKHELVTIGGKPVVADGAVIAEYACVCGAIGTREDIERHITENSNTDLLHGGEVDDDFGGGDTKAHYLPIAPRGPAEAASVRAMGLPIRRREDPPCRKRGCLAPLNSIGTCTIHFTEGLAAEVDVGDAPTIRPGEFDEVLMPRPERPSERPAERPSPPKLPPPPPAPTSVPDDACPLCGTGATLADLPEIAAWSCGHWLRKKPRPVAESFQEMLRTAYQAGAASTASGESFETWYQREVLQ